MSWLRSGYKVPLHESASTILQQYLPFANYRAAIAEIVSAWTVLDHSTASQLQPTEPPKEREQPELDPSTIQDFTLAILGVGVMTELTQRRSEKAISWYKAAAFTSDQEVLVDILRKLFHDASDEVFEDGMGSYFSVNLNRIVQTHGVAAINALERVIHMDDVNVESIEEALRQVGRMDDGWIHRRCLLLLEHALESPNTRIRDAASIGIEAMNDTASIESLQRAIDNERHKQLQQNLKDLLAQLQDTR